MTQVRNVTCWVSPADLPKRQLEIIPLKLTLDDVLHLIVHISLMQETKFLTSSSITQFQMNIYK
jgi:hypothetical protein